MVADRLRQFLAVISSTSTRGNASLLSSKCQPPSGLGPTYTSGAILRPRCAELQSRLRIESADLLIMSVMLSSPTPHSCAQKLNVTFGKQLESPPAPASGGRAG